MQLEGHTNHIYKIIKISNDIIASCSGDYSIKIWDLNEEKIIKSLEKHTKPVKSIVLLSDKYLVSGGIDGTLKVWDI